ncbi:hypothetical protein KFL_007830070 [Klebsormidium nitens]|uniref:Uncharacterized protein n=1 Tax=Klebsormidium nitens TaxID=105231 RepID=A0A1Y1IKN5_KLENI|nr:hypothetical protein KFL_007830070 [Klebsormidium nitens]|eukprot:GAQ91430.1 hypothetical protein KFL_007830070 [Klebsormidium nitens]
MGKAKSKPALLNKGAAEDVQDPAGENKGAANEDLPILPKGQDGASKGGVLGSTSAAVEAGKGVSQLSMLLGKPVLKAPLGGLALEGSDLGDGKRGREEEETPAVLNQALRTGLTDALRAVSNRAGFPGESLRTDPVVVARWSSLETRSLESLEKLVKSKADEDTLRGAKNALFDVKSAAENLKVGNTNLEQKLDHIRSMLAALPHPQPQAMMQPFAPHPSYNNPWQQQPIGGGSNGMAPGAQFNPTPTAPLPTQAAPAGLGAEQNGPNLSRSNGPQAAPQQNRRAYDNDFPKTQLLAIRTLNVERSLPHSSQGMQSLLRKADYPENAINAAESYIPLKNNKVGPSETILTFKVCFPSAGLRAGFFELAQNPQVAKALKLLDISIEEWKDKSDILLERQMRYSANIARGAENELAAQFNKTASTFTGFK